MVTAVAVNLYREKPDVYVGRASSAPRARQRWGDLPGLDGRYGNAHPADVPCYTCMEESLSKGERITVVHDLAGAIAAFTADFNEAVTDEIVAADLLKLRSHAHAGILKLGCFCKRKIYPEPDDSPCHANVIAAWMNAQPQS